MSPVTRYRKVRVRLWLEPPFRKLKGLERELSLYILTGPQTNGVGLYRLSIAGAAEDLGVTVSQLKRALDAVLLAFGWRYEPDSSLVWLPEWADENQPPNGNVVRSWRRAFDELPDSPLKAEAIAATCDFLRPRVKGFDEAFGEPLREPVTERFRNGSPNPSVPVPDEANGSLNRERMLANARETRAIVSELHSRGVQ